MASACLCDVHNYTTGVCFPGYAGRKRCSLRRSFNIHYNTLFIKPGGPAWAFLHRIHPVMHFRRRRRLCWDRGDVPRRVLYQKYLAIISLSPAGQFFDLSAACGPRFYPVYGDACMHYEAPHRRAVCISYSNYCMTDHSWYTERMVGGWVTFWVVTFY